MKIITALLITALVSSSLCLSAQTKKLMTGKTCSIYLKVEGASRPGMPWTDDEITFEGGKLISKVMGKKEGFPPFDCSFSVDSSSGKKKILFTASGHNNGVSEIQWEGTINGNKIAGRAVWTNINGPQTQIFSGTVKKAK